MEQQPSSDERPEERGAFFAAVPDEPDTTVDCAWFRGAMFDMQTILWKHISDGECVSNPAITDGPPSPGGSLYVPLRLEAGAERTIRLMLGWYVPYSRVRAGVAPDVPGGEDEYKDINSWEIE